MRLQQEVPYERISRGFREQVAGDRGAGLLIATLLALALFGILLWAATQRERGGVRRLFRRLADAGGLSRAERRFLLAIGERTGEENPAALFFRKSLFEEAVGEMNADPALVESVRRKVFGP